MTSELQTHFFDTCFSGLSEARQTGLTGWRRLVIDGYGFNWSEEEANMQFEQEYGGTESRKIIVVSNNNLVVASLVLSKSTSFQMDGAFSIHGIVVKPEFQGKSLGKYLYKEAAKLPDVKLISGNTKTPSAVIARTRGCAEYGMRTFYGYWEITPGKEGYTRDHQSFVNKFLINKNIYNKYATVILKGTDVLLPNIPDLSRYPKFLEQAFLPVVIAQKELGEAKTAAMPLLSIRKELLK